MAKIKPTARRGISKPRRVAALGEKCMHVGRSCHRPGQHIYDDLLGVGDVVLQKFELRDPPHDPYCVRHIIVWGTQRA